MQKIIIAIAERHAFDLNSPESYLRLEQPSLMPLVIEKIGEHLISVAHYYTQNGDMMADPDIVFFTGYHEWMPIQITQTPLGFTNVAELSPDGTSIKSFRPQAQAELATFCREWADNLQAQNWLEAKSVI